MDKTDKFEWSVGEQEIYPIDYTQEEQQQDIENRSCKHPKTCGDAKMAGEFWKRN